MRDEDGNLFHFNGIADNAVIVFGEDFERKNAATIELIEKHFSTRIEQSIKDASYDLYVEKLIDASIDTEPSNWIEGLPCQLLQPGEQWEDGRIRLSITAEFIPNQSRLISDSTLDGIRNSIEPS